MAHPLTEFLIWLTETDNFKQYSEGNETERRAMMADAGLSVPQINAVIEKNVQVIIELVNEELHPRKHRQGRIVHLQIAVELPQTDT